ncbi:alpha/beta hydrolase [Mesobacterium sp. TK19101]|uniref:Alpha/beta hydrolase n=1 Tax=Mesobacterium hydrothermale TaxID=3111907 RepID=A0ABU6HIM0_9RHOB|nr:alpha/beta hydrolase [Mesobacterium sp. TK19101]MEC3862307.1 alpha/beta hydrolase [Mesobacterium sp. TK19101]
MKTVYLHGLPGSGTELAMTRLPNLTVVNRAQRSFADLAKALPKSELHLVGFSMGAPAALRLAALCPGQVVRVTIVSPIAPRSMGGDVPPFATGGGLLSKVMPGVAQAKRIIAAEPDFFSDPSTRSALKQALKDGLGPLKPITEREIAAYEKPWEKVLDQIRCQVSIWRGEADPFTTAQSVTALSRSLPYAEVNWLRRCGHYGALAEVMNALARLPDLR